MPLSLKSLTAQMGCCRRVLVSRIGFGVGLLLAVNPGQGKAAESRAEDLVHVTVQLKWLHQFQFAGFYAAIEQGYYEEAGLGVELLEGGAEIDPAEIVLSGRADFGVGTPELLLSFAKGEPIVVLGAIFQHSSYIFIATEESGVDDIDDFAGKVVMIEPQAAELYAYLKRERIPYDSMEIRSHSFSVEDLINGNVQAMSAYSTTEPYNLESAGVSYSTFSPRSSGIDFYGDCLFTTKNLIEEHPEEVKRFYEATLKGWQYAMKHSEEVADLILEKWQAAATRDALMFEAKIMRDLMHVELIPVGYMYAGRWEHIRDTYEELDMLDEGIILDDFLYDPDPAPDMTWLYWLSGGTLLIAAVAFGVLLPVWKLNQRLRGEVEERKRAETQLSEAKVEAERANQAKRQFVSQVSHDLRTPLNAILGFSEAMLHDEKDAERRSYLATINSAGGALLTLVNELLDLDRIESGRIKLVNSSFFIGDVLEPVVELLRPTARRKQVELAYHIEPPFEGSMEADREKLRQILFNLVGNAVKFTDEGSVSISVKQDKPGWVSIIVADTGLGIPTEIIGKIFEPFVRADNVISKEGCGLGLTIAHHLAEAMGGSISAENAKQGAVFALVLPISPNSLQASP